MQALHARIAEVDDGIGAYLSFDLEAALEEAAKADVNLPLGGVPIAIKDNINVAGQPLHLRLTHPARLSLDLRCFGHPQAQSGRRHSVRQNKPR